MFLLRYAKQPRQCQVVGHNDKMTCYKNNLQINKHIEQAA